MRGEPAETARFLWRVLGVEGMIAPDECFLLADLAAEVEEGSIVEIGSYRGRSAVSLALGSMRGGGAPVHAVEPHESFVGVLGGRFGPPDRVAFFRNVLRTGTAETVRLINLPSAAAARAWTAPIHLLVIDGDHAYDGVRRDFDLWTPFVVQGGSVALDDSTVAGLGPERVVSEALASGQFTRRATVGKMSVLVKRA